MHRPTRISTMLALLASAGLLLPTAATAEPPTVATEQVQAPVTERPEPLATDVALAAGGVLVGQVVDADGHGVPHELVHALHAGRMVAETRTDADGNFRIPALGGGVYVLRCQNGVALGRLWAPDTAPPAARSGLLLTSNTDLVRGQTQTRRGGLLKGPLPWIVAIAAIVAVPTALALNLKPASSRS